MLALNRYVTAPGVNKSSDWVTLSSVIYQLNVQIVLTIKKQLHLLKPVIVINQA